MTNTAQKKNRGGFTLVELAVVIVIIGVLAAFGVPRFLKSVERSKAAEAFAYLSAVQGAQERYNIQHGTYASDITTLDFTQQPLKYFSVGSITATEDTWTLTLTRLPGSSGYGQYTVIWTELGFDSTNSGIAALPDINPIGP